MILKAQFIICLALICISSSCQSNGEDCIYLIPKNFEGNLLIVYNQENGTDTIYEGRDRVYSFDTTGILRTKFKPNYGLQRNFYFYIDSLGNRHSLRYGILSQLNGNNEVVCLNKETGKDFDKSKSVDRHFEMITVAKQVNMDSIGDLRSSFLWKAFAQ
ncbi:DUF6843 domain-containing protein [Flavitalea antarctica]